MIRHSCLARFLCAVIGSFALGSFSWGEEPYEIEWVRQFGTSHDDKSQSVALDFDGNAVVAGHTRGMLAPSMGGFVDAFLSKYNASGELDWVRQVGTRSFEEFLSVAMDSDGNIYTTGFTDYALVSANFGLLDGFLFKFDNSGEILWSRQFGTSQNDVSTSVAVDTNGNAYVSGFTEGDFGGTNAGNDDIFVGKFDVAGNMNWLKQVGTEYDDFVYGMALGSNNSIYVTGSTYGSIEGANSGFDDAFLIKFDQMGNALWSRQLGTSGNDAATSVAVDALGNSIITGQTSGSLAGPHEGQVDSFVAKFDSDGNLQWARQIATERYDLSQSVAVDMAGNIYIAGWTSGILGSQSEGGSDAFLMKYDPLGSLIWTSQFGTLAGDGADSVAIDSVGRVVVAGGSSGSFGGNNAGRTDVFLIKFSPPVPEPTSWLLIAFGGIGAHRLCRITRSASKTPRRG